MLLSRVAENVYWAGRYLERAETTARLVHVHTELYLDLPLSHGVGWSPLLAVTGSAETFDESYSAATEENVVGFLTSDAKNPGSVITSVDAARSNLRATRNLLPPSTWEAINEMHQWVTETADDAVSRRSRMAWTDDVIKRCHLISGSMASTMCRDELYSFMDVGRHLERADMTTRVLDVQAGVLTQGAGPNLARYADVTWMSVLRSLAADQMFRRSSLGVLSGSAALRFLLQDPTFPRSVDRCLTEIARALLELPGQGDAMAGSAEVAATLEDADPDALATGGLHEFVDGLQEGLGSIHDAIGAAYFEAAGAPVGA